MGGREEENEVTEEEMHADEISSLWLEWVILLCWITLLTCLNNLEKEETEYA